MQDNKELKDIRTVSVDKELLPMERLVEYVRQIGNPYKFICGAYTFTAVYPETEKRIEDCLRGAIS